MAVEIKITGDTVRDAVEAALYDYTRHQIGESGPFDELGDATQTLALCNDKKIPDATWNTYNQLSRLRAWVDEVRTVKTGNTVSLDVDGSGFRAALEWTRSYVEEDDTFWRAAPERRRRLEAFRDACVEIEAPLEQAAVA